MRFEWDEDKNDLNLSKHQVSFEEAQYAFLDKNRLIEKDIKHSDNEERFFLYGMTGKGVLTVRFTLRDGNIRIFGAGYWRKGKKKYEQRHLH